MIHPLVKIISVDGFFSEEAAKNLSYTTEFLQYEKNDLGKEIQHFNMVPENANQLFSTILDTHIEVDEERSGIFRFPELFIHFEEFDAMDEWVFVVALQESTFNVFEHKSGAKNALDNYKLGYRNLFEWDLNINYVLKPGQGVLFRPWIFHSFNTGLIQVFRVREKNGN